jgi:hypothetical protein
MVVCVWGGLGRGGWGEASDGGGGGGHSRPTPAQKNTGAWMSTRTLGHRSTGSRMSTRTEPQTVAQPNVPGQTSVTMGYAKRTSQD